MQIIPVFLRSHFSFKVACTALFFVMFSPLSFAEISLSDLQDKHECMLIDKGFGKDDVVRLETKDYVAGWCNKGPDEDNADYNILIAYKNNQHDWAGCPNFIPVSRLTTLSLLGDKTPVELYGEVPALNKFWKVEGSPQETLKSLGEVKATRTGLYIGWRDAGQILYCYGGEWLMSGYH